MKKGLTRLILLLFISPCFAGTWGPLQVDMKGTHEAPSGGRLPVFKTIAAIGHRYHGWVVRALIVSDLVGEASSSREIAKLTSKLFQPAQRIVSPSCSYSGIEGIAKKA